MSQSPGVSVIIPLFNEEEGIPQLKEKLLPTIEAVAKASPVEVIFVDDGSTDSTFASLERHFPRGDRFRILRHKVNKNLGSAIRTGADSSRYGRLLFLDSDCTYAPSIILELLAEMDKGYDFVTASPYHPNGLVEGVPARRLFLSLNLSRIYRTILGKELYTFTAMVRAMTRQAYEKTRSNRNDFSAIAEMMLKAVKNGLRVGELPAVLRTRYFGTSKMRIFRLICSHLFMILILIVHPAYFKPISKN